jgi:pyruvate, water dikinase
MTVPMQAAGDAGGAPPALLPLPDAADRALAGGKGASLGELCRAGVDVPPGFVITTDAFRHAMAELDPSGSIPAEIGRLDASDTSAVARASERIRRLIAMTPVPPALSLQIARCYTDLCAGPMADNCVAVRSSATGEDSAAASFAGLQDTYLWVRGATAVDDRVRACWASLYNAEVVSYRRRLGVAEQELAMAVVVQRMVDPRCAGVMFTCSPTTGDRSVVAVEGSWGLGSAMVSGEVTPDRFVVSKVTGEVLRRFVAAKLVQHGRDDSGSGVAVTDVPEPMREKPCLTDDEVRLLAELGRRVENHFGIPQDIEWAIERSDGRVLLLQSRPETYWTRRAKAPVAVALPNAFDHVFAGLSQPRTTPAAQR